MIVDDQGLMNNFAVEPTMYVDANVSTGFTKYAEKVNGRFGRTKLYQLAQRYYRLGYCIGISSDGDKETRFL